MAEIRNPNQQSGGKQQDSRSFLVFSLVFLVMLLALQYFRPKKPAPHPEEQKQQQTATTANSAAPAPEAVPETPTTEMGRKKRVAGTKKGAAAPAASVAATAEQTTTIENENYRIVFTNRGALVKSWLLKRYEDDNGKPLDLVNPETAAKFGFPLSLYSYDAGLRQRLNDTLYVPSKTGTLAAPGELSFEYSGGGLEVKKTFRFDESYVLHVTASVTNNGSPLPALLTWPAGIGDQNTLAAYSKAQFDASQNGKFEKTAAEEGERRRNTEWPVRLRGHQRPVLWRDLPARPAGPGLGGVAEQQLEHSQGREAAQGRDRGCAAAGGGRGLHEHARIAARLRRTEGDLGIEQRESYRGGWHGDGPEH